MHLGLSQSIATLLTIILFYAMDFTGVSRDDQKKISQQLSSSYKFQIYYGA